MDKENKFHFMTNYILLFILIILFALGSFSVIYFSKDTPIPIFFICIYILFGVFHCVENLKLLVDIRKISSSKDTLIDSIVSELKSKHKAAILLFIVYLISLPCIIAVLLYVKGAITLPVL